MIKLSESDNRRIFISDDKKKYHQIFHFTQKNDGSIYVSWPNFPSTNWLYPSIDGNGNIKINKIDFVEEGKLSIHGSGMSTFRSHNNPKIRPLIIMGNKLLDLGKNEGGARHLFTAFIKEPNFLPNSPALNRESDYLINSSKKIEPFVIIFFAIPKISSEFKLNFSASFNIDDVGIMPNGGFGSFNLKFHTIFWYVYNTNNMINWPKKHQVIFNDGFIMPIIIGTRIGQFSIEFRSPSYLFTNNNFFVEF